MAQARLLALPPAYTTAAVFQNASASGTVCFTEAEEDQGRSATDPRVAQQKQDRNPGLLLEWSCALFSWLI